MRLLEWSTAELTSLADAAREVNAEVNAEVVNAANEVVSEVVANPAVSQREMMEAIELGLD